MVHFNWIQLLPGVTHANTHVATAMATSLFMMVFAFAGRMALGSGDTAVIPASKFSIKGLVEEIIEFIHGLTEMVVGEEGSGFVTIFATLFFYIFVSNLVGLIPGMTPATDNLNTTIAMGIFAFLAYNFYGLKEHGISYLKHFLGPVLPLAFLIGPIEIISHALRPMTLGIRLQGNIFADHTVVGVFIDLCKGMWFIPIPAAFYGLGLFVCFMQAFVFTMLCMIYVSMAISHDH